MTRYRYRVYGSDLSSSIPLPELRPVEGATGPVRWHFEVVETLPPMRGAMVLGEEPIYGEVSARLLRHDGGHRIEVDDTGAFDLVPRVDGTPGGGATALAIRWQPLADPWWDFGRAHLLGRVLATALHLDGTLTLHGSAVVLGDGVVAFLAPKHHGKSTLSRALHEAGAPFVTDDALPVDPGPPARAFPGVPSLRILPDGDVSAQAVTPVGRDGKVTLAPVPEARSLVGQAPLSALYLLDPRRPGPGVPDVVREPLPSLLATALLVGQAKIGAMLGSSEAGHLLDRAAALVEQVPVSRLALVRDLDRLPQAVEALFQWHGPPRTGA